MRSTQELNVREYRDKVRELYTAGAENALEVYERVYCRHEGETDLDFVARCAELDYEDAGFGGALFQELFEEAAQETSGWPGFPKD